MKKRLFTATRLAIVAIPMVAVVSLLAIALFSGGSAGGTLATGRSVMTYSDSMFLSSEFRDDTATIKTDGKMIVVKPTALLVDGVNVATIDAKVADVKIRVKDGTVDLFADGRKVASTIQ